MNLPRKIYGIPSKRHEICPHEFAKYTGAIPMTGPRFCDLCGSTFPTTLDWQVSQAIAKAFLIIQKAKESYAKN
jgi:hypothetical protein